MKNIFLIPTDKESRLWRDLDSNKLTFDNLSHSNSNECTKCSHEYVYITSDEKLKDGEYGLSKLNEVITFHSGYDSRYYMKIVMTNDLELIEDGVQQIEDDVMDWFVENPTCEYFNIEQYNSYGVDNWKYLITLPTNGVDFGKELSKWGYNKGNSIDVEILINEILPELFKQFNK